MLVTSTLVGRTVPGWPQLRWTRAADAEEEGPRAPRKLHRRQENPKRSLEAADGRIQGGTFCGRAFTCECNVVYASVPNHKGREPDIWVETRKEFSGACCFEDLGGNEERWVRTRPRRCTRSSTGAWSFQNESVRLINRRSCRRSVGGRATGGGGLSASKRVRECRQRRSENLLGICGFCSLFCLIVSHVCMVDRRAWNGTSCTLPLPSL